MMNADLEKTNNIMALLPKSKPPCDEMVVLDQFSTFCKIRRTLYSLSDVKARG